MLALRGWGEQDFRLVSGEFMEAIRYGLFAEMLAPELHASDQAARTSTDRSMSGKERLEASRLALLGAQQRTSIRAALGLDDPVDEKGAA